MPRRRDAYEIQWHFSMNGCAWLIYTRKWRFWALIFIMRFKFGESPQKETKHFKFYDQFITAFREMGECPNSLIIDLFSDYSKFSTFSLMFRYVGEFSMPTKFYSKYLIITCWNLDVLKHCFKIERIKYEFIQNPKMNIKNWTSR